MGKRENLVTNVQNGYFQEIRTKLYAEKKKMKLDVKIFDDPPKRHL